jgi:predicted acyl esterase
MAYVETQHYMMTAQDRATGDYNTEWDHRNLTRAYDKIPSDVGILQTNGQQDWNVMPRHAYQALQAFRDKFPGSQEGTYGTHKIVSALSKHASQTGRLVPGKDGVQRGMLKWYLMFLDHYLLGLDNKVDELMYDINIANSQTGVMEGFDYDTSVEERGTILPGTHYQKIYLTPGPEDKAGRLSYFQPASIVEGFTDLTMAQQINAPQHPGAPARPSTTFTRNASQGNFTPTSAQINYCDDRVVGVNRTTTNYGTYGSLIDAVDRPVDGRLMYISEPLEDNIRLSGTVVAHLNGMPTKGTGNLTVALVEIGRLPRAAVRIESVNLSSSGATSVTVFPAENGAAATTAASYGRTTSGGGTTGYPSLARVGTGSASNFKYVTWGHTDIQNPSYDGKAWFQVPEQNYTPNYYFQTTELVPGKYYDYVVELNPYNYVFEKGQRIGVMVYGTDMMASPSLDEATTGGLDVMLGKGSYIDIPLQLDEPTAPISIEVSSASVALGDTVEITYSIADNAYGFAAFELDLPFDASIFTPVEVTPAGLLSDETLVYAIGAKALQISFSAEDNIVGDGDLFTVTYKVKESAPYIFSTPLDVRVDSFKFSSLMDKTIDLKVNVDKGVLSTKLVELVSVASIKKLNGNKNELTIIITETYEDSVEKVLTKTFTIDNNAANTYAIDRYQVFVDTKGNDQIRACYILENGAKAPNNQDGNSQG